MAKDVGSGSQGAGAGSLPAQDPVCRVRWWLPFLGHGAVDMCHVSSLSRSQRESFPRLAGHEEPVCWRPPVR